MAGGPGVANGNRCRGPVWKQVGIGRRLRPGCDSAPLPPARLPACPPARGRAGAPGRWPPGAAPTGHRPMPFRPFFPSAPEGAWATTAPAITGRSRLAPPGTAHKRLPAGRATAASPAVASSPANDLGNFALPGNFAVRGNKTRVARAEVPRNAEFPRYGHRVHRGAPGEPDIRDGPRQQRRRRWLNGIALYDRKSSAIKLVSALMRRSWPPVRQPPIDQGVVAA